VRTWLPQPDGWAPLTARAQADDSASMLELYRRAVHVRRRTASLRTSDLQWLEGYPSDVLAFRRDGVACIVNLGAEPVRRAPGEVLLASAPDGAPPGDMVEPDAAVWVRTG
jgi:alpha-glucosidase